MPKSSRELSDWPPLNLDQRIALQQEAPIFQRKSLNHTNRIICALLETPGREWEWISMLSRVLDPFPDPNVGLPEKLWTVLPGETENTLPERKKAVAAMLLVILRDISFRDIIEQKDSKISWISCWQEALRLLALAWKPGAAMRIFSRSGFEDTARQYELGRILPLVQELVYTGQADPVAWIMTKFRLPQENIVHQSPHFIWYRKLAISMTAATGNHFAIQSLKPFIWSDKHIAYLHTLARRFPERVWDILAGNPIDADTIGLPHTLSETSPWIELLKKLIHEWMTEEVWALLKPLSSQASSWKLLPVLTQLVEEGKGIDVWSQIYAMDFAKIKQWYFADRYLALLLLMSEQFEDDELWEAIRILS